MVECLLAWMVCVCEADRRGSCVYCAASLSSWWDSESNWTFSSNCIRLRDLPHSNQDNYSSTVLLPISPAACRHLGLCKDMVADLVLGIPRPNFLGDALLTSIRATEEEFCRAESRNKFSSFSHHGLGDMLNCSCWLENPWEGTVWGVIFATKGSNNAIFRRCK